MRSTRSTKTTKSKRSTRTSSTRSSIRATPSRAQRKTAAKSQPRRWSAKVTATSDALDLDSAVFKRTPSAIARSVKRSAERSKRRKSTPYRSAMSMLTFYENRAGKNLSARQRNNLERAKDELRKLFGR
jgi:hypothetical protein